MAFQIYRSKGPSLQLEYYPKKASTAFSSNALVYPDGSGAIQPATASSLTNMGVIQTTIASTDADYASNTLVPVLIPDQHTEFLADVGTGTLTTAMVGLQFDLKDSVSIDVTANSHKAVTVIRFISATQAIVKLNASLFTTPAA